uniref:Uncharacterized protein n=1 Tax=Chromera velia CCMP2878 TaxID=1169474 RepID=A0A0G4G6J0_9ALVE|eukprot:Cvel_20498.t1-p1 / transcript=Cvel_20498.t1 / gene=Cvel_20498 / organism=Chromera_velia_CCMP2878 / gene_product=hypothetical protein / transcript_product=hypothetical protein / location=Cvel_scaffold1844:12136-16455(-) / protein_length=961 / sequence_SO=supercontig / SO=protein_coding / is_pseudo=false
MSSVSSVCMFLFLLAGSLLKFTETRLVVQPENSKLIGSKYDTEVCNLGPNLPEEGLHDSVWYWPGTTLFDVDPTKDPPSVPSPSSSSEAAAANEEEETGGVESEEESAKETAAASRLRRRRRLEEVQREGENGGAAESEPTGRVPGTYGNGSIWLFDPVHNSTVFLAMIELAQQLHRFDPEAFPLSALLFPEANFTELLPKDENEGEPVFALVLQNENMTELELLSGDATIVRLPYVDEMRSVHNMTFINPQINGTFLEVENTTVDLPPSFVSRWENVSTVVVSIETEAAEEMTVMLKKGERFSAYLDREAANYIDCPAIALFKYVFLAFLGPWLILAAAWRSFPSSRMGYGQIVLHKLIGICPWVKVLLCAAGFWFWSLCPNFGGGIGQALWMCYLALTTMFHTFFFAVLLLLAKGWMLTRELLTRGEALCLAVLIGSGYLVMAVHQLDPELTLPIVFCLYTCLLFAVWTSCAKNIGQLEERQQVVADILALRWMARQERLGRGSAGEGNGDQQGGMGGDPVNDQDGEGEEVAGTQLVLMARALELKLWMFRSLQAVSATYFIGVLLIKYVILVLLKSAQIGYLMIYLMDFLVYLSLAIIFRPRHEVPYLEALASEGDGIRAVLPLFVAGAKSADPSTTHTRDSNSSVATAAGRMQERTQNAQEAGECVCLLDDPQAPSALALVMNPASYLPADPAGSEKEEVGTGETSPPVSSTQGPPLPASREARRGLERTVGFREGVLDVCLGVPSFQSCGVSGRSGGGLGGLAGGFGARGGSVVVNAAESLAASLGALRRWRERVVFRRNGDASRVSLLGGVGVGIEGESPTQQNRPEESPQGGRQTESAGARGAREMEGMQSGEGGGGDLVETLEEGCGGPVSGRQVRLGCSSGRGGSPSSSHSSREGSGGESEIELGGLASCTTNTNTGVMGGRPAWISSEVLLERRGDAKGEDGEGGGGEEME